MSCGCQNKKLSCYERVKQLAEKFAKAEGVVCALYRLGDTWQFSPANAIPPGVAPYEFVSPLQ